jgi:predicted nucleotide-binding protein (sugar kinase/HSP70/actin superfamily)
LPELPHFLDYTTEQFNCKGCENLCLISKLTFNDISTVGAGVKPAPTTKVQADPAPTNKFFTGNKCEKVYTNKGKNTQKGDNHYDFKLKLLNSFIKPVKPSTVGALHATPLQKHPITVGIPRALNMYENFPFWSELFYECGINVVVSRPSTFKQYEKGIGTVMSDNICFPAKLMHGHIYDLLEMKVARIFFPFVVYETKEHPSVANSFNCPVVTGYAEVLKSSIDTATKFNIPLDSPTINFDDEVLLKKACYEYLKQLADTTVKGRKQYAPTNNADRRGVSHTPFKFNKEIFENAFEKALKKFQEFRNSLKQNCIRIFEKAVAENRTVIMVAGRPYHTDQLIQHKLTDMISEFGVDVISDDLIRDDDYSNFSELNTVSQWSYTNRIMRAAQFVGQTETDMHFIEITSFGCGPDAFVVDEVGEILKSYGKTFTLLKVDDVSNIGSLKLRVRSLLESLKFKNATEPEKYKLKQTPQFRASDRNKTILAPFFSEFYSPFVQTFFEMMGYKYITLPPSDEKSIEYGLKYANNEICYPATLVIGDVIRELKNIENGQASGDWDLNNIVICMTQTGGQCRATNYIMLIKKALLSAGYENIPVISIAFDDDLQNQQEFILDYKPLAKTAIFAALYADSISKMYYSAAAHEENNTSPYPLKKGELVVGTRLAVSDIERARQAVSLHSPFLRGQGDATKSKSLALRDKYISEVQPLVKQKNIKAILKLLHSATEDFNSIIDTTKNPPKIGIVGEIYVKYNSIGHKNVVNWLVEQNVEVVMPPILSFFIQYFVNRKVNIRENLERKKLFDGIYPMLIKKVIDSSIKKVEKIASNYKLWMPFGDIDEEAKEAEKIISLATQFGEGWLIPAEIFNFDKHGVQNVVSLQPFGCIANHIISKGIEKKIKQHYIRRWGLTRR